MTFKYPGALKTLLCSLLITQMVVAVPVAHAEFSLTANPAALNSIPANAKVTTAKVKPLGADSVPADQLNAPAGQAAAGQPAAQPAPSNNGDPLQLSGSKPYCQGLADVKADRKKVQNWKNLWNNKKTSHEEANRILGVPTLLNGQKEFASAAEQILSQSQGACEYKRVVDTRIAKSENDLKTSGPGQGAENCDRIQQIDNYLWETTENQKNYIRLVKAAREGVRGDNKGRKESPGLIQYFKKDASENAVAIKTAKDKISTASVPVTALNRRSLEVEFNEIWGQGLESKNITELEDRNGKNAVFAQILDELRLEEEVAKANTAKIEAYQRQLRSAHAGCQLSDKGPTKVTSQKTDPAALSKAGAPAKRIQAAADSDVDLENESNEDKVKRLSQKPADETAAEERARTSKLVEAKKAIAADQEVTRKNNEYLNGDNDGGSSSDYSSSRSSRRSRLDSSEKDDIKPLKEFTPKNNNDSTASNFLSNNAGLLVGGALVVGGGAAYYFWDKNEKKKKQDEWEAYWNSVKPSGTSTSTSTSTSTTHRLQNLQSLSNAIAGMTLPGLQVAIVNSSGVTLTNEDTDITISCINPIPCSLTGTTIVRSVNGVATFTDLRFLNPHTGVRLRYSTSWGGIEQTTGFDVTAGTATSSTTATSTSTSTGSGTTTVTSTNTSTSSTTSTNTGTDNRQ